jgi:type 1 glutamine amidotransferase
MKKMICLIALFIVSCSSPSVQADNKIILLIGHKPDHQKGTHVYMPTLKMFEECLQKDPSIKTHVINGWPTEDQMAACHAIVLYGSPGAEICLKKERRESFMKAMNRGVGMMAIHWSTGLHKKNITNMAENWERALGGYWPHHSGVKVTNSMLNQLDKKHPICRGWSPYDLRDEYYLGTTVAKHGKALLDVRAKGKTQVVAWVAERPNSNKGRSFGTTLGHFGENFEIKAFRQLMLNGILWVAHKEIPESGAPCYMDIKVGK